VINNFADIVGNKERLDMLYLLTAADMRATSPSVWNSWKGTLLKNLYNHTLKALRKKLNSINNTELALDIQTKVLNDISNENVNIDDVKSLWETLHEDYFLRYNKEEIISHALTIPLLKDDDLPLIIIRDAIGRGGTEVFIYTKVDRAIFTLVTSILEQKGVDIADARIIRSSNGYCFDSYIILDRTGNKISSSETQDDIKNVIHSKISKDTNEIYEINRIPPRQLRHFTMNTNVQFDTDSRNQHTIMEVITADRAGLLASIGRALNENKLHLHNARICTFGARAEDLFYITNENSELLDLTTKEILRNTVINTLDSDN